jgi:hypothetical protein
LKTALVKTDLCDDDLFFELNIDTKLLYMIILLSPERGVGRIFRLSKRMQSFRTGLSEKQLLTCQEQLEAAGVVYFYDQYVYMTEKSSFIQPVKGKLTAVTLERELKALPADVIRAFKLKVEELTEVSLGDSLLWLSGDSPVHVNVNDKVNDIVSVKDKDLVVGKQTSEEAVTLATTLRKAMNRNRELNGQEPRPDKPREIEKWATDIEKIHRIDGEDWKTIYMVLMWCQQDLFWRSNIQSGKTFREKFERLLIAANAEQEKKNMYGAEIAGIEGATVA